MSESEKYLFDHFCLSVRPGGDGPAEVTLYSKGRPQTLTQQEAKTLQILVEKQGLFVETNTLAREVCGDDRADEGVIHTAISGLRRIFNDPAKVGEFIRNERKKGYCFVKSVRRARDGESDEEAPTQSEGSVAQAGQRVEETALTQAADREAVAARPGAADVAA